MEVGVRIPPCAGPMGFAKFAEWAAEEGFQAIDVRAVEDDTKRVLAGNGLKLGTVDLVGWAALVEPDEAKQAEGLEQLKPVVAAAAEAGATAMFAVLLPANHAQPRKESFEIWKRTGPKLVEILEANDQCLAIEAWVGPGPYWPSLGCTPETLRAMFAEVPSERIGLCYDPSHLVRLGIDHIRFLWEFGQRIRHVHGKDTELSDEHLYLSGNIGPTFGSPYVYGEGAWRYCIPGEGLIDWVAVANRLQDIGYDGLLSVELEDHYYYPEVDQQLAGLSAALTCLEGAIGIED